VSADSDSAVIDEAMAQASFKISRRRWKHLLSELARRGQDRWESGAFLLSERGTNAVTAVAFYDDLDPNCLTGGISFASAGFTDLWRICRSEGLTVVADVHTHPGTRVMQSDIDATNPMIARVGHVAIIVPSYGRADSIQQCGVNLYLGSHRWLYLPAAQVARIICVYGAFSRDQILDWKVAIARLVGLLRGGRS
jgi:proteasome lid subunit RPN8/RPN11